MMELQEGETDKLALYERRKNKIPIHIRSAGGGTSSKSSRSRGRNRSIKKKLPETSPQKTVDTIDDTENGKKSLLKLII